MNAWRWIGGAVVLAAAAAALFASTRPVALGTVAVVEGPLVQTLVFSGRVAAPVRVELGATVTGRVLEVAVREGDEAKAGDVLARLESAELQAQASQAQVALRLAEARLAGQREVGVPTADAALEQAIATLEAAQREARRNRELFERGYVAQARIDETDRAVRIAQAQLESARAAQRANAGGGTERAQAQLRVDEARAALGLAQARLAQARIVAPADGRVVSRTVDPGQIVQPGRALFVFAPRGATQLVGQADEKFLSQLALGQPARVLADAFPQRPFDARVTRIAPGVDAQRGTVEVKFDVPEPPPFLREDMTLSMQVATGRSERALTLPAIAVVGPGLDAHVRRIEDGRVVERPVRTGLRTLERVEIVDGLRAGDAVLADPFAAEPGARARPAR
ncbi:MAG: efflux RND transporter periplasmic adaptor subunit, partial [Burkholderiales bacterium]|nr:efflux RND transporter periplasmic adaptor subunit [Burkholderiales bacterium]